MRELRYPSRGLGRHTFPCSPPRPMHLRRRVIMAMASIAVVRWAPLPPPERRSCPFDKLVLAHDNPCTSTIAPLPRDLRSMAPVLIGSSALQLHRSLLCIRVALAHWRAAPSSDSVPDVSCFHLWPHGYASATATSSSLRNWETGSVSEGAKSGGGWGSRSERAGKLSARGGAGGRGWGVAGGGGGDGRTTH